MTKGNKIRLILWGFVWLVLLSASVLGIYSYYNGKGISGKTRNELKPIIDTFNNLNELNIYKNAGITMKAKFAKNAIKVNYKTSTSNLAYLFDYKDMDGTKVLYMKYNDSNASITQIVIREMIDAISVINGHEEGEIFNLVSYNDLYRLSLNEGISIKYSDNSTELYIDVNKSVADYISGMEKTFITKDELKNINDKLNEENKFTLTKNAITIYVESNDEKYTIYGQNDNYDDDLYKSINNVINSIDLKESVKSNFELNYPSISTSKEFENYVITINDDAKDIDVFKTKNNIIKVEIIKDINEN